MNSPSDTDRVIHMIEVHGLNFAAKYGGTTPLDILLALEALTKKWQEATHGPASS